MKLNIYSLVSCIALLIVCFVSQNEAIMENKILEFLEEIRHRMCHPLFGLPALDPFQVEHASFSMNNKYVVNLNGSITDFRLTGLSDFNVTNLKISTIPLKRSNVTIVLPLTNVKSLYTAKGSLAYIVNFNGDDEAEAYMDNVKLSISWITKTGVTLSIRNLRIQISIGSLFVDIGNFFEEPRLNDFFHALVNELGIEILNDVWLEAQEKGFIKYVESSINKFLGNYTLMDIIKIINSISNGDGTEEPFGGAPANCKTKLYI